MYKPRYLKTGVLLKYLHAVHYQKTPKKPPNKQHSPKPKTKPKPPKKSYLYSTKHYCSGRKGAPNPLLRKGTDSTE